MGLLAARLLHKTDETSLKVSSGSFLAGAGAGMLYLRVLINTSTLYPPFSKFLGGPVCAHRVLCVHTSATPVNPSRR
jgi:hypothetical protein